MRMLMWFDNSVFAQDEHGQMLLDKKPELSFSFDQLKFYDKEKAIQVLNEKTGKSEWLVLTPAQAEECELFITALRGRLGNSVLAVDKNGVFLGKVPVNNKKIAKRVFTEPPNGDHYIWDFEKEQWLHILAVDSEGRFLGNVPWEEGIRIVPKEPPQLNAKWSDVEQDYVLPKIPLEQKKLSALSRLNGLVSLRAEALRQSPDGRSVLVKISKAIVSVLEEEGCTDLAHAQRITRGISIAIRSAESEEELEDIEATIRTVYSTIKNNYGLPNP